MRPRPPRLRPMSHFICTRCLATRPLVSLATTRAIPTPQALRNPPTPAPTPTQQIRTIKSIVKNRPTRPSRWDRSPGLPTLGSAPAAAQQRKEAADTLPLRTGALATKKGMTALFDPATGARTPCTVLQLDRVQVVAHKTARRHGYFAVCVGAGWRKPENVGRAMLGVFARARATDAQGARVGLAPKKDVREFRVRDERGLLAVGKVVAPSWFAVGQFVDAQAKTRGMGFAGGMKRYGFKGQPASHGVSLTHRSMGSAGGSQGSGSRVHPGKRMPGRMGGQLQTTQNLKVLMADDENGILVVSGCVSGPKGILVKIQDAKKKPWPVVPDTAQEAVEKHAAESG